MLDPRLYVEGIDTFFYDYILIFQLRSYLSTCNGKKAILSENEAQIKIPQFGRPHDKRGSNALRGYQ